MILLNSGWLNKHILCMKTNMVAVLYKSYLGPCFIIVVILTLTSKYQKQTFIF